MNKFNFNIQILNKFIQNKQNDNICCTEIYNIICKCYDIEDLPKKIHICNFISAMCRDSVRFKSIDDKYISQFIDITICLFWLQKLTNMKEDIKFVLEEQLVNIINKTMSKLSTRNKFTVF